MFFPDIILLMSRLIAFCKPFAVLCQFSPDRLPPNQPAPDSHTQTLADFIDIPDIYPAGRLDKDSEGLLLLTDNGGLQHSISHPKRKMQKTYWVQVEGIVDEQAIQQLCHGVMLKDGLTKPAQVKAITEPDIWPRTPPVRYRANIPTSWLEVKLKEGRNRQVRRMTAAVGYPTLRLIRYAIGPWSLDIGMLNRLQPGQWQELKIDPEYLKQEQLKNDRGKKTAKKSISTTRHRRRHHRT